MASDPAAPVVIRNSGAGAPSVPPTLPNGPPDTLAELLYPIDREEFLRYYWEKQPLALMRGEPGYYRSLLSLANVDGILANSNVRTSDIRIVENGREIPVTKLGEGGSNKSEGGLEALYQHYRSGATVVLLFLQERWRPLRRLCQSLAAELSAGVQVNVYLTPPGSVGLSTHYDTHDVLVLQAAGSKRWRLFGSPSRLPLAAQPSGQSSRDAGVPSYDFTLNPGDLLYMPRGFLHDAASLDVPSLHLTVGMKTITWSSVILDAVQAVCEAEEGVLFRESLPIQFATDGETRRRSEARLYELLRTALDRASVKNAIEEARKRALLARLPALEGHLLDLQAEPSLTVESKLRLRPEIAWRLSPEEDVICLEFHGKVIRLPSHAGDAVRFIVHSDGPFSPSEVPGLADDASRLVLVRRLLTEGFLTCQLG